MAIIAQRIRPTTGNLICIAKWFSTKVGPKTTKQTKFSRDRIQRFNWENTNLYGPLLKVVPTKYQQISPKEPTKQKDNVQTVSDENPSIKPKLTQSGISGKTNLFPLKYIKTIQDSEDKFELLANDILQSPDGPGQIRLPSVTGILQKTMSPESADILDRWRKRMIAQLGQEGFAKYQQDLFSNGKAVHKRIHNHLQNVSDAEYSPSDSTEGYWQSISSILPNVSNSIMLEEKITHPFLHYLGIVDCVAQYRGKTTLIEWKTSQKPKPKLSDTYDNPLQIAAYMGAFNFKMKSTPQIQHGLIVIAYPDGKPAHAHLMDEKVCHDSWNTWLSRLQQFWQFQKGCARETTTQ